MAKMREQLMSRNVASEVANDITASVQATLTNQKLKSFTRCEKQGWLLRETKKKRTYYQNLELRAHNYGNTGD